MKHSLAPLLAYVAPAVAGVVAPFALVYAWQFFFGATFFPLAQALVGHGISVRDFDIGAWLDAIGGAVIGLATGALLAIAADAQRRVRWFVFASCFLATWLASAAAVDAFDAAAWLLLQPLFLCFLAFSAVGFLLVSRAQFARNVP